MLAVFALVSGGRNLGIFWKPWKTDQAVSVYTWTKEWQTSFSHHCKILCLSPATRIFIFLTPHWLSSLLDKLFFFFIWSDQLFKIVILYITIKTSSRNMCNTQWMDLFNFLQYNIMVCLFVFRGVAVLIWSCWRSTQSLTVKTVNFLFASKLYRGHAPNLR